MPMKVDYSAIQARLDARKEIGEILSSQVHPWEMGYKFRSFAYHEWDQVKEIHRIAGMKQSVQVFVDLPYSLHGVNPLVFFAQLIQNEVDFTGIRLHGKLCFKCESMREMRRKGRSRILPEEP